jgi:fatty-acyl-CoA synthase
VIGVKDEKWGERPMALVVRDPESADEVTDLDIKAHLKIFVDRGIISKFGIPETILFVELLARTSVGKINKKELRERYGDS